MGFDTAQNSMQKLSQILGHKKISNQSPLRTTNYTGTVVTIALVSLASEYSVAVRILVSSTFIYKDKTFIHPRHLLLFHHTAIFNVFVT